MQEKSIFVQSTYLMWTEPGAEDTSVGLLGGPWRGGGGGGVRFLSGVNGLFLLTLPNILHEFMLPGWLAYVYNMSLWNFEFSEH